MLKIGLAHTKCLINLSYHCYTITSSFDSLFKSVEDTYLVKEPIKWNLSLCFFTKNIDHFRQGLHVYSFQNHILKSYSPV